jgi:branched-chain amino acid transport system substrate-binding protein
LTTSNNPNEDGITDDAIVLGIEDTTNSFSLDEENRGFRLAFEERNARGPINGRRITWKGYTRASGADVDAAVVNARKLVLDDRVFALINIGGPEAMTLAKFAEENRVPYLFPHTTLFASRGQRYVFTSLPHCTGELRNITQYLARDRAFKQIAIVRDTNEYGDIYQDLLNRHASEFGYTVSGVANVGVREPEDLSEELKSVADKSEAVFMALYPAQARALMSAKDKLGWNGVMIASGPLTDEQYLGASGASAEGTLGLSHFPDPVSSDEPGIVAYRAVMDKYHPGRQLNRYTLYGYVYGKLIIDALERAGRTLTRETFVDAMEATADWDSGGIIPPVSLSKDDHHAQRAGLISELRNGRFVPVGGWVE